tara:strand:- start:3068 stop:3178 length:111 start_codon:yes stop_codon:yes gene_type:complete
LYAFELLRNKEKPKRKQLSEDETLAYLANFMGPQSQ